MYIFSIPETGATVEVPVSEVEKFMQDNPTANYLGGAGRVVQKLYVGDSVYRVDNENLEDFLKQNYGKIIETESLRSERIKQQKALAKKYGDDPFDLTSWDSFMDWWRVGERGTQEKNTWAETLLGKNQLTDLFSDQYRAAKKGVYQALDMDDLALAFKVKKRNLTKEEQKRLFEAVQRQEKYGVSDEMIVYMNSRNTIKENGTFDAMDALSGMSPSLMLETFTSSMVSMGFGLFTKEGISWGAAAAGAGAGIGFGTGAAIGAITGPGALLSGTAGAIYGGIGGLFSGVGGALEATGKVGELIREEMRKVGMKMTFENFEKFIKENPDKLREIRSKAITKGVTIAAVDTLVSAATLGMGKAVTMTALPAAKVLTKPLVMTGSSFVIEGAGGAAGEYLSQRLIGERSDPKELFLEATGGGPVTALALGNQILNPPSYKINGDTATRSDVWELLSNKNRTNAEIANTDIEINNDPVLEKEYKARRDANAKENLLPKDPKTGKHIISKTDRDLLYVLETALETAKEKGSTLIEVLGSVVKVQNVKAQVDSIYESYQSDLDAVGRPLKEGDVKSAVDANRKLMEKSERVGILSKKAGLIFEAFDFTDSFKAAVNKKLAEEGISIETEGAEGIKFSDGTVFIDRERALEVGAYESVAVHETFHNIVDKKFFALNDDKKKLLVSEYKKILKSELDSKTYKSIEEAVNADSRDRNISSDVNVEWFNKHSDQVSNSLKSYKNKKSLITKLKSLLQKLIPFFNKTIRENTDYKNFEFGNAKSMFDFIEGFSRDAKAGRDISYAQKFIDAGGETQLSRTELVDDINKMQQGARTREEFLKPNIFNKIYSSIIKDGGAINNYIKSLRLSPEQTQETIDGVADRLINFNPAAQRKTDTGTPITLGEFIMANVGFGKLDAAKKLATEAAKTKQEKSIDSAKRTKEGERTFDIEDTDATEQQDAETQDISPQAEARRKAETAKQKEPTKSKLRQAMGIKDGSDAYNAVLETARKVLIKAYNAGKTARQIQRDLTSESSTYLFKLVKNMLGTKRNYIGNITKFRVPLINSMFTADLVQLERNVPDNERVFTKFVSKLTSKKEVQKAVDNNQLPPSALNTIDKGQSVSLYEKVIQIEGNQKQENDFIAFFDQPAINPKTGARSGLKGTRKDQLAKYASAALNFDATMQVAQELEVAEKRQLAAELRGETIDDADILNLSVAIGRDQNVQFSRQQIANGLAGSIIDILNNIKIGKISLEDVVDKVDKKYSLKIKLRKTFEKGQREHSKKDKDFAAEMIYQITQSNKYAQIVDDDVLFQELVKDITKYGKPGKRLSLGAAFELRVRDIIAKYTKVLNKQKLKLKGDVYIVLAKTAKRLGIEVKLHKARGVSQQVSFKFVDGKLIVTYPSVSEERGGGNVKNPTIDPDTNELFDDIMADLLIDQYNKLQSDIKKANLGDIVNFELNENQRQWLMDYGRFNYYTTTEVTLDHVMNAYSSGKYNKAPQGMLQIGRKFFRLITNNESVNDLTLEIKNDWNIANQNNQIKDLKLKDKNGKITLQARMVLSEKNKVQFRVEPLINEQDFVDTTASLLDEDFTKAFIESAKLTANKIANTNLSKSIENAKPTLQYSKTSRGMSTFDFDETLIDKGKNFIIAKKDNKTIKISSSDWPIQGPDLADQGYTFDFSDFVKVRGGVEGPLLQKMRNQIKKFGSNNVFVLTARPPEAASAIHNWLKTKNINIPIKNITGLGDSTSEAKAAWMLEKFAEGYNDMYFVDDALPNVKAVKQVLDQLDIKSKVQQVRIQFSRSVNDQFNDIIEQTTGVETEKRFSDVQANLRSKKGRYFNLVPPSAQDFAGLLYNFLGKGKIGEQQFKFFKKTLIDPFARGINELNTARQRTMEKYMELVKSLPKVKKKLTTELKKFKDIPSYIENYNVDQAIRVYLWNKNGIEVPGMTKRDTKALTDFVKNNPDIQSFADVVGAISKDQQSFTEPGEYWLTENIKSDLFSDGALGDARSKYLTEWQENVDQMFSPENMNKIKVIYGNKFVEALQDILYRMKTGRNRPTNKSRLTNEWLNWVNGSVGAIMFFNIRSAVLQTISSINYINWSDNNPLKAAAAFANQKQFWKDFSFLFNSDFLKQRRAGNQRGVNEQELSEAVTGKGAFEQAKAAIRYLLKVGFLPTQIADSFAIASGGSTFYRNRIKKYVKDGMTQEQAEKQAFLDFQEITEVSQQSARPDLISQQQADALGRLILSFQNTPMQYGRIMDKAFRDIINRRGDTKTHVSKIAYYGVAQGILFTALQSALFASWGDEDDEVKDKKKQRMLNGIVDSWLSTFGYGGKGVATVKNTMLEYQRQRAKDLDEEFMTRPDHAYTILTALSFSPPIGSKLRKIYSSIQTERFNRDIMRERGFKVDNPAFSGIGNIIEAVTNLPLGRLSNKLRNLENALDTRNETWQRVALVLGWNTWDLGIKDQDIEALGEDIKERKKQEKKMEKIKNKYPGKTKEEIDIIIKEKEIFDLSKREQENIIKQNGLNPKKYKLEKDRVDIIIKLRNKDAEKIDKQLNNIKNYKPSKSEQREIDLYKMNKKEQVNLLMSLGLSSREIKKLKYEEDRVNKIIKLENKRKSKNR